MILRGAVFGLLLLTVLLLQAVVAPSMEIAGVAPNLVVLSVLAVGLIGGSGPGLRYGFVAGLVVDLLTGAEAILGVSALLLLLAGYAAGLVKPFIAASELPGRVLVAGVGVVLITLFAEMFEFLLGRETTAAGALLVEALLIGVYAAVLAPFMCLVVAWLERLLPAPA